MYRKTGNKKSPGRNPELSGMFEKMTGLIKDVLAERVYRLVSRAGEGNGIDLGDLRAGDIHYFLAVILVDTDIAADITDVKVFGRNDIIDHRAAACGRSGHLNLPVGLAVEFVAIGCHGLNILNFVVNYQWFLWLVSEAPRSDR